LPFQAFVQQVSAAYPHPGGDGRKINSLNNTLLRLMQARTGNNKLTIAGARNLFQNLYFVVVCKTEGKDVLIAALEGGLAFWFKQYGGNMDIGPPNTLGQIKAPNVRGVCSARWTLVDSEWVVV
jgi:hypothetical protein